MPARIISADSHVTETPDVYGPRMAASFRDQAPYVTHDPEKGDLFVIPGMRATSVPVGLIAAAGKKAEELKTFRARFADLHPGGWDPKARLADQDRDGIGGEILYPTIGMNGASTASRSAIEMLRAKSGMRVSAKKNAASPNVVNSGTMPKNSTMWLGVRDVSRTTT